MEKNNKFFISKTSLLSLLCALPGGIFWIEYIFQIFGKDNILTKLFIDPNGLKYIYTIFFFLGVSSLFSLIFGALVRSRYHMSILGIAMIAFNIPFLLIFLYFLAIFSVDSLVR